MAASYRDYLIAQGVLKAQQQAAQPPSPGLGLGMPQSQYAAVVAPRRQLMMDQQRLTAPPVVPQPRPGMAPTNPGAPAPIPYTRWGDTIGSVQPRPSAPMPPVPPPINPATAAAAQAVASLQRRGTDGESGQFDPSSQEYAAYTTLIGAGMEPEEARLRVLRDYMSGPTIPEQAGETLSALGDAGRTVYESPIMAPVRKTIEYSQKPYEWAQEQTGQDIYKQAMNGGTSTTLNPYYYVDGSIENYALDPNNKAEIQAVYERGLDINGDGAVDVAGGNAVMLVYNAKYHPGFFDSLVTSLAMDPLFAASLVAPAAAGGRSGAQAAGELATIANMSRAERVLAAVDRTLAVVTKAGDIGNRIADIPITGPIWAAKMAGKGVAKVPGIGQSIVNVAGLPMQPGAQTAERLAANEARDVAESITGADIGNGIGRLRGMPAPTATTAIGPGGQPTPPVAPIDVDPRTGIPVATSPEDIFQYPDVPAPVPPSGVIPGGNVAVENGPIRPPSVTPTPIYGPLPDTGPMPLADVPEQYDPATGVPLNLLPGQLTDAPNPSPIVARPDIPGGDVSIPEDYAPPSIQTAPSGVAGQRRTSSIGTTPRTVKTISENPRPMVVADNVVPPDIAVATGDVPVRKSVTGEGVVIDVGDPSVGVRVVVRNDGQFEVQTRSVGKNNTVKWTGKRSFADEGEAIAQAKAWSIGDEVPPAKPDTTPVKPVRPKKTPPPDTTATIDPDMPVVPLSTEDIAPTPTGKNPGWSLSSDNHPNGRAANAERMYPEQWAKAKAELADISREYEAKMSFESGVTDPDLDLEGFNTTDTYRRARAYADRKLLAAEFNAAVQEAMIRNGIPVETLPNEAPRARVDKSGNPIKANRAEELVGQAVYENAELAKAARSELRSLGYMLSRSPRADLADNIARASLPSTNAIDIKTGKTRKFPDGAVTFQGKQYTNVELRKMSDYARNRLAQDVLRDQQIKFNRYQRLASIRERIDRLRSPGIVANPAFAQMPTVNEAYDAVRDAMYRKLNGPPAAPGIPKAEPAQRPFAPEYRSMQTDEINRLTQFGEIGEETKNYLRQVVSDDGEEFLTAWDVLKGIIERRIKDLPDTASPNSRAMREWRTGVSNEFAEAMKNLTGKAVPPKIKRTIASKILGAVAEKAGLINRTARENLLFNAVTGPRGWAQDVISTNIKLIWEGHLGALEHSLSPRQWFKNYRHERDALDDLADRFGMDIPDELHISGKFDEATAADRTGTNEIVSGVLRIPEGSVADKAVGYATAPISSRMIARGRQTSDNLSRRAVFQNYVTSKTPETAREFRRKARLWANKYGILPSSMDAYLYELGDQFTPEHLGRTIRELGEDAGLGPAATNEIADMMAQQWRKSVNTLRNDAFKETKRVLFSYEKTRADEAIGRFIFFHYWMSRALPSYARLALRNPELMALWSRAWEMTAQQAEREGYPPTFTGWLRFMGDGATGWSMSYNPLQFFIPFDVLRQDPYADTTWEMLTQFTAVSPVVQAVAAVAGLQSSAPDVLGLYAVRNGMMAGVNKMRANGWIGDISLPTDWYDRANTNVFNWLNDQAARLPYINDVQFTERKTRDAEGMDYEMRGVVEKESGVPYSATDPRWQPGGDLYETWAEAARDFAAGVDNPVAERAYGTWAEAHWEKTKWSSLIPGGVRLQQDVRTNEMALAREGYAALDAGEEPSPEQQAAMDFQSAARAGSPEDLALDEAGSKYAAIGTPRQQGLARYWKEIVYDVDDRRFDGTVLWMDDNTPIAVEDIRKMDQDERMELADAWIASIDGTDDLKSYRTERNQFLTDNPEYGAFDGWRDTVRAYEGGPRVFRTDRAKNNPNFARAMREKEAQLKEDGVAAELIPLELDEWTLSLAAYKAAQGIKDNSRDPEPLSTGDQGTVDTILRATGDSGSGGSSSPKKAMTTAEKLTKELREYEAEVKLFDQVLAGYGIEGGFTAINNPLMRRALENQFGDLMPTQSRLLRQYLEWRDYMNATYPGSDTSPEAFQRLMDQLAAEEAA